MAPAGRGPQFLVGVQRCCRLGYAGEHRLVCDLGNAVRAAHCGVQATLWLTGEVGLYGGSSRLDQMVDKKSSGASGVRLLRCRRNWDGL
jgi:hypothetical protein